MSLIICHIGGGISITAHEKGKMIDSNDIANGDGPMTPTRCGAIPVRDVVNECFSGKYTPEQMYQIGKYAGAMAAALHGHVDGIILTGGISHDKYLVQCLTEMIDFIAPVGLAFCR